MPLPAGLAPLLTLLVLASPLGDGDVASSSQSPGHWRVEVIGDGVRMRAKPDVASEALGLLHKGEVVEVRSWLPIAKSIPVETDEHRWREPGFWIRVRDDRQREGWIASVFALPENAWPKTPWMLGHVYQAARGGSEPDAGRLMLDVVRTVDRGLPAWFPPPSEDELGVRARLRERLSALDSVELLEQDGRSGIAAVQGTAFVFNNECPDGMGVGPAFDGLLREVRGFGRRLGVAGLGRDATKYPLAERGTASGPFFQFLDEKELLRFLGSARSPVGLPIRALSDVQCVGPVAIFIRSSRSNIQLRSCYFSDGERLWSVLFGIDARHDTSRPWLVRFSRPDDDNPIDDEVYAEAILDDWYVTDLNQDGVLELWLQAQTRAEDYRVFTWEIYFVDQFEAFGPWFIEADGGPACD